MRALSPEHLRLATLNVWGTRGDWQPRRERLAAGFAELAPDLLTLQETIVTDTYDQVRDVLGDGYHLVHQTAREDDGQGITTASRWPVGQVIEVDLQINDRTTGFACTSLVTEILAPEPFGRIWLVNHFPSWRLDLEHERCLQTVRTARVVERLAAERHGHVIVAGDLDADPDATSIRFWTGRHPLEGMSVCYRDAWASAHPTGPGQEPGQEPSRELGSELGHTYVPGNPYSVDWDWPFRRIDYVLVRCALHGGPTLAIADCVRTFDQPDTTVSDHYGVAVDLSVASTP